MKKISNLLMMALLTVGMGLTSCEGALDDILGEWSRPTPGNVTPGTEEGGVTSITVDLSKIDAKYLDSEKTKLQLTVGDEVTLSFTILPEEMADTKVELTADDETILSIDGLKVTAKKAGETKVTAKAGEMEAYFDVMVKEPVNLSNITEDYTAQHGTVLTSALAADATTNIKIADGATVTLKDVTINGTNVNDAAHKHAGITCVGDATIILEGTNSVKGFYNEYPGIQVPEGKTLIIQGNGSLNASSNGWGAGIGGGYLINCGNITISGGTVEATGGKKTAGIGGGYKGSCGNIVINGGTVTATGGESAAGIGGGQWNTSSGTITITSGVTSVIATKGTGAPCSIGKGDGGQDITVTIGGVEGAITTSPYEYPTALSLTSPAVGQVIGSDGKNYAADATLPTDVTKVAMIAYVSGSNGLAIALANEGEMNWATAKTTAAAHTPKFTGGTWKLPTQDEWKQMFSANGGSDASYNGLNNALATAGGGSSKFQELDIYWSSTPNGEDRAWAVGLADGGAIWGNGSVDVNSLVRACLAF